MRQKSGTPPLLAEDAFRDIRRATRKRYSAEEKIRIVLEGLRGDRSIAELCRQEGIARRLYYSWSKKFLVAGCSVTTAKFNRLRDIPIVRELCVNRSDIVRRC